MTEPEFQCAQNHITKMQLQVFLRYFTGKELVMRGAGGDGGGVETKVLKILVSVTLET